jgi:hypothetical protein
VCCHTLLRYALNSIAHAAPAHKHTPCCTAQGLLKLPSLTHVRSLERPSSTQVARALLAAGADPDLPDRASGQTPLHYAASNGHMTILEELLSEWLAAGGGGVCRSGVGGPLRDAVAYKPHIGAMMCSLFDSMLRLTQCFALCLSVWLLPVTFCCCCRGWCQLSDGGQLQQLADTGEQGRVVYCQQKEPEVHCVAATRRSRVRGRTRLRVIDGSPRQGVTRCRCAVVLCHAACCCHQAAAIYGRLEVCVRLVEEGSPWPSGKGSKSGGGDVVALLTGSKLCKQRQLKVRAVLTVSLVASGRADSDLRTVTCVCGRACWAGGLGCVP